MNSCSHQTEIHLGIAVNLGPIGIQCTVECVHFYQYEESLLVHLQWDQIKEIRFKRLTGEVKFTITLNNEKIALERGKWLRLRFDKPQELINQIVDLDECVVKVTKLSNIALKTYLKPSSIGPSTIDRDMHSQVTEQDFEDLKEIAQIAEEFPFEDGNTN